MEFLKMSEISQKVMSLQYGIYFNHKIRYLLYKTLKSKRKKKLFLTGAYWLKSKAIKNLINFIISVLFMSLDFGLD